MILLARHKLITVVFDIPLYSEYKYITLVLGSVNYWRFEQNSGANNFGKVAQPGRAGVG